MAPAATAAIEALLQALGGRPGASAAELADGAGIGRSTANKLLVKLAAEGRVVREAGGRRDGRRRPDRWTVLAPAPTQLAKDPDLPPTTPHPSIPDGAAVGSSAPPARRLAPAICAGWCWPTSSTAPNRRCPRRPSPRRWTARPGPSPTPWRSWPVRAPSPRPRLPPPLRQPPRPQPHPYQPMTGPLHPTGGPAVGLR